MSLEAAEFHRTPRERESDSPPYDLTPAAVIQIASMTATARSEALRAPGRVMEKRNPLEVVALFRMILLLPPLPANASSFIESHALPYMHQELECQATSRCAGGALDDVLISSPFLVSDLPRDGGRHFCFDVTLPLAFEPRADVDLCTDDEALLFSFSKRGDGDGRRGVDVSLLDFPPKFGSWTLG